MLALACSCGLGLGVPGAAIPASQTPVGENVEAVYLFGYDAAMRGTLTLEDLTAQTSTPMSAPVPLEGYAATGLVRAALGVPLIGGHRYTIVAVRPGVSESFLAFDVMAGADSTPPPIPDVLELDVGAMTYGADATSSCGPQLTGIAGTLTNLDVDSLVVVRFTSTTDGTVIERAVLPQADALATLGTDACSIATPLVPGATYDVEIFARDVAGNDSAARTRTITVRDCGEVGAYSDVAAAAACVYGTTPPVTVPHTELDDGGCAATPDAPSMLVLVGVAGLLVRRRTHR